MSVIPFFFDPSEEEYAPLLERQMADDRVVEAAVQEIISTVRRDGDRALYDYAMRFDQSRLESLYVTEAEFQNADALVSDELKKAIETACRNIYAFHSAQKPSGEDVWTEEGVHCWRKIVPIQKVGLYVPGGTAPLFSTVLMLAIPAVVAGCSDIILATPAKEGKIAPAVLYAARRCGIKKVLKVGGAQAIAAFAYGTESVSARDKIFGPGNRYVAFAKNAVSHVCAIDMLAGPSEVMVVADRNADPLFVATDLLSQAEHGKDSQVILLIRAGSKAEAKSIYEDVESTLSAELEKLGRKEYMLPSLSHSSAIAVTSDERIIELVNAYAPEHLILNTVNYMDLLEGVQNAGSVFLGPYSPESAGDYASGTNHTLPTSGAARSSSGVSVDSFIKKITVQELTDKGIRSLGPAVIEMAEAENLTAHAEAARVRCR